MPRFPSSAAANASLARRGVLLGAAAATLAGCHRSTAMTAAHTPKLDGDRLGREIGNVAERVRPGVLGVGLMNLDSGETWALAGERRFPMQSVWKLPLGAAALAEVDAGRLRLDEVIDIKDVDLSPPFSAINDAWPARRDYTARQLLVAAVGQSDNTAADVLAARIGGPGAITAWLVGKDINEVRVDRYERELQCDVLGLEPFRPAWKSEAAFAQAIGTVPPAQQRAALSAYLADPRDTATPRGMLHFLELLMSDQLVTRASKRLLLQIMTASPTGAQRVRAGLPKGSSFAHKTGTGRTELGVNPATNDVGVITLPDRRRYALAVFLAGSTLGDAARDAAIADVARAVVHGVR